MSLAWVSTAVQMFISTNAVIGLTEVVTEIVKLKEEVTELKKVGIYPYNAEATDSIFACCRMCR